MENNTTARSIHCSSCGSTIHVSRIVSEAQCLACGNLQSLNALNPLQQHHSAVDRTIEQAQSHRHRQSQYKNLHGNEQIVSFFRINFWLFMVSGVLGISIWLSYLIFNQDKIGDNLGNEYISPLWNLFFSLIWIVLAIRAYRNRSGSISFSHSLEILCHNCGAPGILTHGQDLDQCNYCRATLIPNASQILHTQRRADQVKKRAYFALQRARRNHKILRNRNVAMDKTYSNTQVRIAVFVFIPLSLSYILSIPMALIDRSIDPIVGYAAALSGLIGLIAAVPIFYSVAREHRRRISIARDIAASLPGRSSIGLASPKSWIEAYWNGPFPNKYLYLSDYHVGSVGYAGNFPVLIDIEIWPPSRDMSTNRKTGSPAACKILMAADIPGLESLSLEQSLSIANLFSQIPPDARLIVEELQSQGWELEVSAGGVLGICPPRLFRSIIRDASKADELSPVLERLGLAAAKWKAIPVGPHFDSN